MKEKPKIQQLYEWIKSKGKVASFEIYDWGSANHYPCAPRKARYFIDELTNPHNLSYLYPGITRRLPYPHERINRKANFKIYEYRLREANGQIKLL